MSYLLVKHAKTKEWAHPNYEVPYMAYCKKPKLIRATRMACEFKLTEPNGDVIAHGEPGDYLVETENGFEIHKNADFEANHDIVTKMERTFLVSER